MYARKTQKPPSKTPDMAWSISKADTAMQCMYKFKRVYIDKVPLFGHALTLGSTMHEIQAEEIEQGNTCTKTLQSKLDKTKWATNAEYGPEIYGMVPHVVNFVKKWQEIETKYIVKPTIETKYGLTKDFKPTGFLAKDVYFRGIIDLWGFSESTKKLIVMDHKTNKNAMSPAKVKDSIQLNMYVWMLTKIYEFDWERAHIALHFLRHGKIVWAGLNWREVEDKVTQYFGTLKVMEERIAESRKTGEWEPQTSYLCNWCQFKRECPAHATLQSYCTGAATSTG